MNKIICIGECALDIVFDSKGAPAGSMPGGRIALAAARLGRQGLPVAMASEASSDPVGDMLVAHLTEAGVDCTAVDRFTQGHSPLSVFTPRLEGSGCDITRYEAYGDGGFDVVWPRVDDQTLVVFGGYYSLDPRMRQRLVPFLTNCAERKAVLVYVPGFRADRQRRMTRVMPAVLENLEIADIVIARNNDMHLIFGTPDGNTCYRNHVDFYCRSMVNIDPACNTINYYSGKEVTQCEIPASVASTLMWNPGVISGTVAEIFSRGLSAADLDTPTADLRQAILTAASREAIACAAELTLPWQQVGYNNL